MFESSLSPMHWLIWLAASMAILGAAPASARDADVWWAVCPPDARGWGPFGSVDGCRERLEAIQTICEHPTYRDTKIIRDPHDWRKDRVEGVDRPHPDFLKFAAICKNALNATACRCIQRAPTAEGDLPSPPGSP